MMNGQHPAGWIGRTPFFYGWFVLLAGTIGAVMTSPGQTYTVSLFIESFIDDLALSRTAVSSLYSVATLTSSLLMWPGCTSWRRRRR